MARSNHSKHRRSKRSSMAISNDINYDQIDFLPELPIQCSAYFLARRNLNDYTDETLKETVDSIVSGPKSKGLKVKLSLPDNGLIVDNVLDPNQSWMHKISELLYFWQDFYYTNTIVVVTINRTEYQTNEPYSASIFRLRGHDSIQLFIQRAQEFFAQLLTNNSSITTENLPTSDRKRKHSRKVKPRSATTTTTTTTTKQSVPKSPSSKTKTDSTTIRTEFDPKKTTNSSFEPYKRRTYSETTASSDTRSSNSKKLTNKNNNNNDDNDKMTTITSHISNEYVAELVRELKELRNEIATLKLEAKSSPVHSTSTSPIAESQENSKNKIDLKQLETDAETQTDLTLINDEKKQLIEKNETKIDTVTTPSNKTKQEVTKTKVNKRTTVSNNILPDREESTLVNSSQINSLPNEKSSSYTQAEFQPISNSKLKSKSKSNLNEKDLSLTIKPVIIEKEIPKILSTNSMNKTFSVPKTTGEIVSFRASLDDTITSENIYENLPIFIKMNSNQDFYYNTPSINKNDEQKGNKPNLYLTIADDQNSNLQQEYLSQLFGPDNGIALLLPKESIENNFQTTQDIKTNNQNYFQQTLFSDHLTNPLFNVDKQLLANTIANQFGIDHKSPSLQKLIANQHLFVANKRTFANMIWQMTPEEENALCSSPETVPIDIIDTNTIDANSPTAKSILKPKKSSRSVSKGQRISWDRTLE